ncbi:hypothetical protein N2152v2_009196 [Parachlorella kessleri]
MDIVALTAIRNLLLSLTLSTSFSPNRSSVGVALLSRQALQQALTRGQAAGAHSPHAQHGHLAHQDKHQFSKQQQQHLQDVLVSTQRLTGGYGVGPEGGSKWDSKPAGLMGLLRPLAQQPSQEAASEPENPTAFLRDREAVKKGRPARDSGNGSQRRQACVLDSPDTDGPAASSQRSDAQHSSEEEANTSTSDSSINASGEDMAPSRDTVGGGEQQPGTDATVSQMQAAVQRQETGALLAARDAGAAVVLAGRKRALQRHYSRRGKGRQKKLGSGMQAKLQLAAVSSKRSRK